MATLSEQLSRLYVKSSSLTKKRIQEELKTLEEKIVEYEGKIHELDVVKKTLEEKSVELASVKVRLESEQIEAQKQTDAFNEEYKKYLSSKEELEKLQAQIRASYSTEDISSFLNKMINDFNTSSASDTDVAKYIINNMDVDLKVRIYDDSKNNGEKSFKFTAPSISETTEDSLSSIKITIQAVPK
ncbi:MULTISPECIES: hypothetical protein [unclassified Fibrobacter]|uniref:hypothetical protein n=1 Tax=unclassified Fibrobacter TaxID=2634177 RepID=UPI000914A067|nr:MULTISPECIES: hypothetical protein [Fibrobacter]MCL4102507.1 hypothetical protein [Fibrobacter succinogenes]MCQ2100047.1 hypothetical protein [Fibrobacter sp.]OWV08109.1 hypothetical protein B7993_00260 [Fibrobacter sp. UWH3]SHK71116.1 hypothetical protein SAMN05720765_104179 [Fibrobacter sp. UWH6]